VALAAHARAAFGQVLLDNRLFHATVTVTFAPARMVPRSVQPETTDPVPLSPRGRDRREEPMFDGMDCTTQPPAQAAAANDERLPANVAIPLILAMSLASWAGIMSLAFFVGERLA
jgi:hypothetical protein